DLLTGGIASSLQENNEMVLQDFSLNGCDVNDSRVRVLVDPQTSGGLLASVPSQRGADCLNALRAKGYSDAALIGRVAAGSWELKGR
ncbi:MAG: hypothetical protein VB948_14235, partial [Pseudomonadales bacterium]